MKAFFGIKFWFVWVLAAFFLQSCEEETAAEVYGDGSPSAENVITRKGYVYEYNTEGLVTKISCLDETTENEYGELVPKDIAYISYPQSNRAVMKYVADDYPTTYTFAFGENHFANRMIESGGDGESSITYFSYDSEGHITSLECEGDKLKLEWTDGNLTKVVQDEYGAYTELTYTNLTDFALYDMSPFLLELHMGPYAANLGWWFDRGLTDALYIGFLGQHSKNLPAGLTAYDDENAEPEKGEFNYYNYGETSGWRYHQIW